MLKRLLILFSLVVLSATQAFSHSVQSFWEITNTGKIRFWLEHWHGDVSPSMLPNFYIVVSQQFVGYNTGNYNVIATGAVNNTTYANLPTTGTRNNRVQCSDANTYLDWVYYDFAPAACNQSVSVTFVSGPPAETMPNCGGIFGYTVSHVFNDVAGPVITAPNTSVGVNTGCTYVAGPSGFTNVSVADICDPNPTVVYKVGGTVIDPATYVFPIGATTVTIEATDHTGVPSNNTSTGSFVLTVRDQTGPTVVTQNFTVTLDAQGSASITTADIDNGSFDVCSSPIQLSLNQTTFSCSDVPSKTVTLTATDAQGNSSNATAVVTVNFIAGTLTAPADVSVNTDVSSCIATGVSLGSPTAAGSCYTVSNNGLTEYPIGNTNVIWTLTNVDGTTVVDTQVVTVVDANTPWVQVQDSTETRSMAPPIYLDSLAVSGVMQNVNGARIVIASNFNSGDVLNIATGGLASGVTQSYNSGTGVLSISGTMTPAEFQTLLRHITFNTTSNAVNVPRTISITAGQSVSLAGHYYEYVSTAMSWTAAKTAAENRTLNGMQGYLATITSQTENNFIKSKLGADAWIGGSDEFSLINAASGYTKYSNQTAAEGNWHWVTGPEAGTFFSAGNRTPVAQPGQFAYWNNGEPNNSGSEHYAEIYSSGTGAWNDLPNGASLGYVVEYGGSSNDLTCISFSDEIVIDVATLPIVTTDATPILVGSYGATVGGEVTNQGGSSVTDRGIVYSTSVNPTTSNGRTSATVSTGIGTFSSVLTGLTPNTVYYAKAYAINSSGTAYGAQISFRTAPYSPGGVTSSTYNSTLMQDVICYGDTTTLTASSVSGVIHWFTGSCGGTQIGQGTSISVNPTTTTTYYARNYNNGMYSDTCATLQVVVRPMLVAPVISGAETICWSSMSTGLSGTQATGGSSLVNNAGFSYQWQQSLDSGATWQDIVGETNYASLLPGYLYQTTQYRLLATDLGEPSCYTDLVSNVIEVEVRDPFTPSVVSMVNLNNTVCNSGDAQLTATPTLGGSGPMFQYQWQSSPDSLTWTNVGSPLMNTTSLTVSNITTDTYFRLIAFDLGTPACGSVFSSNTVKAIVQTNITEGSISGAQHICAGDVPANPIASVVSGTGRGVITYRWEESTDNGQTWATVQGAVDSSLTLGALQVTTDYRRYTVSTINSLSCESTLPTNEIRIEVDQLPIATLADGDTTSCVSASVSIPGVTIQYGTAQWVHDGNGTLSGTASSPVYTPATTDAGNTVTLTLTVTGTTICQSVTATATYTINVDPLPEATAGGSVTICENGTHTVVGASSANGTVLWTHDGSGTLADATTDAPTYTASASDAGNTVTLTMTVSSNNTCTPQSAVATYTILVDQLPAASAGGTDIICSESSATVSGASSARGSILWTHDGNGTLTDATTLTPTYTADASDAGTTVTLTMTVTSTNVCGPQTAVATHTVIVRPDFIPATFVNQDQDLCYNSSAGVITATAAQGGTGPYAYQWQVSTDSVNWSNISGATSLTYTPSGTFIANSYYRILSTDQGTPTCGNVLAGTSDVKLLVRNPLTPPTHASSITVCNNDSVTLVPTAALGGRNNFIYQWQQSSNGTTGWVNIGIPSTNPSISVALSVPTTYYRVIARDQAPTGSLSCGSTFSQSIQVNYIVDLTAPVITGTPSNIQVNADAGMCTAVVSWVLPTATDDCQMSSFTSDHQSGDAFPVGSTTVTYTAVDMRGNTSTTSFVVTVVDNQLPVLSSMPANITVNLSSTGCGTIVNWSSPVSSDNCGVLSTSSTHTSGALFPVGRTHVVYTVVDVNGNTDTAGFWVEVLNVNPVITGTPANITVSNAAGVCSSPVSWTAPTASHSCSGMTLNSTHAPGATFPVGVTTVTYTAVDVYGGTTTSSFTVTVLDTESPVWTGTPANITVNSNANACNAQVSWTEPVVGDNCTASPTVVKSHVPGATFALGTTTVTYTGTDAAGNATSTSFTVTVVDATAPVIAQPSNITASVDANACSSSTVTITAPVTTDQCDVVSPVGTRSDNLLLTDDYPLGVTTITWNAVDLAGNQAVAKVQTVTVIDTIAPYVVTQLDSVVYVDQNSCVYYWENWRAGIVLNDNCGNTGTITSSLPQNLFLNKGVHTLNYTVSDNNGNSRTYSHVVEVVDTIHPILTNMPSNKVAYASSGCGSYVTWVQPTASDNCVGFVMTNSMSPGDWFGLGTTVVTFTVTDASGLTAVDSFTVTVMDTVSPVLTVPSAPVITPIAGQCSAVVTWGNAVATDNCSATMTSSATSGSTFAVGTHTVVWTATDPSGNSTTSSMTFTVSDVEAPAISNLPSNMTLYTTSSLCAATGTWSPITATDNCSTPTVTVSTASGTVFNLGVTTITVVATDAAGNSTTGSFNVTVMDTISPIWVSTPQDITVGSCASAVTYVMPVSQDNCSGVTLVQTSGLASGSVFPIGVTTNTFVATDSSGNSVSYSFDVTVQGMSFSYAPGKSVFCASDAPYDLNASSVSNLTFSGNGLTGSVFHPGTAGAGAHTITYNYVDSLGCQSTGTFELTVYSVPDKPTILRMTSTMLKVDKTYASYQWRRYGVNIPGAVNQTYSVTLSGIYDVVVSNGNCTNVSDPYGFGVSVGQEELALNEIRIQPNPNNGRFILIHSIPLGEVLGVQVVDMTGRVLLDTTLEDVEKEFDMSMYSQGTYMIVVKTKSEVKTLPVVIQY